MGSQSQTLAPRGVAVKWETHGQHGFPVGIVPVGVLRGGESFILGGGKAACFLINLE